MAPHSEDPTARTAEMRAGLHAEAVATGARISEDATVAGWAYLLRPPRPESRRATGRASLVAIP